MLHITEEDYQKINQDLQSQTEGMCEGESGEEVTTNIWKDGYSIDVSARGFVSVKTQQFYDAAWGRGRWFTEYNYFFEMKDAKATAYDEDENEVETDFDRTKVECDWECSRAGDS